MTANFSAQGEWSLHQSNGIGVGLTLFQDSNGLLKGSANTGSMKGSLESGGKVDGDSIFFIVKWDSGSRGRYAGTRSRFDRRLTGTTSDLVHPENVATWSTVKQF
ncbi:hypothetical protein [Streptomyces sp. HD]|uniref:hypothetical protein n=1 Tax=Streptomyces sp. HD TaxID=3020892 RepID=UPI00232E5BAF|nr:hypothetical protein [Streptomyces sp. HD]MDC0771704.1 hypothetical protein [Streptomyces sp. HD]